MELGHLPDLSSCPIYKPAASWRISLEKNCWSSGGWNPRSGLPPKTWMMTHLQANWPLDSNYLRYLTVKQTDGLEKSQLRDFGEGVSSRGGEGMMTKMIYKLCDKEVNKQPITRWSRQVADGRTVRAGMWEDFAIFSLWIKYTEVWAHTHTYRQFWSGLRPEQEANFLLRWARWRLVTHTH